jgi:hypothetical protein
VTLAKSTGKNWQELIKHVQGFVKRRSAIIVADSAVMRSICIRINVQKDGTQ